MKTKRVSVVLSVLSAAVVGPAATQMPPGASARVDAIFSQWNLPESPGCAVGVAEAGTPILSRAYGMSDLEHDIPSTAGTIFEAGSVSKQFTAAAVILLALDGKLSLDDDVRKFIPEVPEYDQTVTLRHMMTHTSGLRDWGSVAAISGWGRNVRTHNHEHVVDIVSRQSALNFEPGHEYSYSNTGYNLLAVVVSRVSGMSFADFSTERVFQPLGMHHTQWRDDYTRIVKGRSTAYSPTPGGFRINRPIEDVHGNGGLLTTVGDLLVWNESLDDGRLGGPDFVRMMHDQGQLNDGRTISYAAGLQVGELSGVRSITHTGSTSGYRAYLGRFPDHDLSIAILCNVSNANPGGLGAQVARTFLGDAIREAPEPPPDAVTLDEAELQAMVGLYRMEQTGQPLTVSVRNGRLSAGGGRGLVALSANEFQVGASDRRYVFVPGRGGRPSIETYTGQYLDDVYHPTEEANPSPAELREYEGTYHSEDAETTLQLTVEDGRLVAHRRPNRRMVLEPVYPDAFNAGGLGLVRFHRNASGQIVELGTYQGRVYDMRFQKLN